MTDNKIHKIMDVLKSMIGKRIKVVSCGNSTERTSARLRLEDGSAIEFSGSKDSFEVTECTKIKQYQVKK